jgi:PAS domain S-box-containing protein
MSELLRQGSVSMTLSATPSDARTVGPVRVAWEDGVFIAYRSIRRADDGTALPVLLVTTNQPHPRTEIIERLVREYELRDILDCPAAIRPLALLREEGRTILVLEDWEGERLESLPVPLEPVAFLRLAVNIASALGKVHARGLVHRDINSLHILVDRATASVRLTGFGMASLLQQERQVPEPPEFIAGTLAYMAPEQTGRMNRSVDLRSDLYSLGVVFYRMLTGSLPFASTDPMELVHCHIARQARAPVDLLPALPPRISAIVMKLLAKTAEDRYQTAGGVAHDLRQCLARWDVHGRIVDFPLGAHDVSDRLLIPEKLYGREPELGALAQAFERTARGGVELALVAGYAGIGKSALVNELQKNMVSQSGLFLAGKFDQINCEIPYLTLAQAFRVGVRMLLSKAGAELQIWRDALLDALGPNGLLVVELVPELAMVIGDQPPVPALAPLDTKRRFHLVFGRFISVFARADHPLVLFLDDLQWLDPATLEFLEDFLAQSHLRHLLVVGAYRDNEVRADHPLVRGLERLRGSNVRVLEIMLSSLDLDHVERLVIDALHCSSSRAVPLSRMLHQRTSGNPFFLLQFIRSLADENLIRFEHASGQWTWDVQGIQAKGYTDNAVGLMVERLSRLPMPSQTSLRNFACIGNVADLAVLEMICDPPRDTLHESLSRAIQAGLILRSGNTLRFLHDRVQEAAYTSIAEADRPQAHLRIARLLLAHTRPSQREEAIFEIVNQFNRALHLIDSRAEREEVAALNLAAARRAKASTAYASALVYLAVARSLLTDADWERNYELMFSIEYLLAECELLNASMREADARLDALDRYAKAEHHVSSVTRLRITLYTALGESERSVELCLRYLRRGGTDWKPHPDASTVRAEYEGIAALLGDREIEDLIDLPLLNDPGVQDTLDVLTEAVTPAFFTDTQLCALMLCRMVRLSIAHGNSDASCYAYVWLATYAGPFFAQYETGFRFGCLGYRLVEKRGLTRFKARTYTSFGNIVVPWARHVREGREPIQRAFRIAQDSGDFTYTLYICCDLVQNMVSVGDPLGAVQSEVDKAMLLSKRSGFELVHDMLATYRGLVRTLSGATPDFGCFTDTEFDETEFEQHLRGSRELALPAFDYWTRKLQARYLANRFAEALDAKSHAQPLLWVGTSQFETAEYHFFGALSHAACWDDADEPAKQTHIDAIAAHRRHLDSWALHAPQNFENRAALVGAEMARMRGDVVEAERLYDLAVRSSRRNGFVHNEAIACEAVSRFYAGRGLTDISDLYLRNARYAYGRWGAKAKVRQLDDRYPHILQQGHDRLVASSIDTSVEHLDLATVIKVSQTISGEIQLDNLVRTVIRTAISHAGAERGLLIGSDDGELMIEAQATVTDGVISVSLERTALDAGHLPNSIAQYAFRTRQNVIINDALVQHDFSADPYFRAHQVRSVVCMPLVHQGKPIALLYLENNLVSHLFTASRVAVLKLLASQAASSLEISHLYRDLAEREARIRRLVDANIIGVFIWDMLGPIYEANDAFLRMTGYSREDLAAGRVSNACLTPGEWQQHDARAIAELRRSGALQPVERELIRADGVRVPVLLGAALYGTSREEYVAFVVDLTEQKQAEAVARENERRFHEIEKELTRANRVATLGQLTASISHEIRQPVASAVFNAQAAIHWLEASPPNLDEVQAALVRVINNGTRATDVIRRIRELVKKAPARREPVQMNEAIREVIALAINEASKRHVSVTVDLEPELPLIEGDRVQLQQVLMNLIINAVEAMEHGEGARELTIATSTHEASLIRVSVTDNGPGIGASDADRLFEPFYTTKETGMGMGLSICRSIVEAHGGTLMHLPISPHGAVFRFELPRASGQPG